MKEFVPKEVVRISELLSGCNEVSLILNIPYGNSSRTFRIVTFNQDRIIISLSYHHHIFVNLRILERLDVANISEHLPSQP